MSKGDESMDITREAHRLHCVGFREELLDRAVALAGAQRLMYTALYEAVTVRGLSPEAALQAVSAEACPL